MTKAKLQEFEGSVISIILPTRGRTGGALQDSIKSLLENADDPSRIEIMLGVDDDDKESIDWVNNEAADFVSPFGCACKAKVMEGSVKMDVNYALDEDEVDEGYILTCQSHPTSDKVVIDFDEI